MRAAGASDAELPITTIAEKCVWESATVAYCAVPQQIPGAGFLTKWYRGEVHTEDVWYTVDAGAAKADKLFTIDSAQAIDVESPAIDPGGATSLSRTRATSRSGCSASLNNHEKDMKKKREKNWFATSSRRTASPICPWVASALRSNRPSLRAFFDPNTVSLAQFFNTLFKTAIVLGAMFAVLRLGYAGFKYMTTDLPGQKGNAREIISQAVIGLLLLLAVWLILNQINPDILNLDILRNVKSAQ